MSNTPSQKQRRAERAREFVGLLAERFPDCFTTERKRVRPLAIGIQQALRAALNDDAELADTPNWLIKQALARYTRAPAYLEAVMAGAPRVDLRGNPAGEVTDDARAHARARREEQKQRAAERRRERGRARKTEHQRERLERLADKFNNR